MASIVHDPAGRLRITFTAPNGKRPSIRLPKGAPESMARQYVENLNTLLACHGSPELVPVKVLQWAAAIEDDTYAKLADVELMPPRVAAVSAPAAHLATVGALVDAVTAEFAHAKFNTRRNYTRVLSLMVERFGRERAIASISPRDADGFVTWMRNDLKHGNGTVSRRIKMCRWIFNRARRWEWVERNPFDGIRAGSSANPSRKAFVSMADFERLIASTPDLQFRCVLALSRLGALRCPSEVVILRWADVRWDDHKLIVRSPKTEGHAGGESRIVPLFPRLADILAAWQVEAPEGVEFVIQAGEAKNFRTRFTRLITRAGVKPWPKLFHNMRASRESELCAEYPLTTVCGWLGHRPEVAAAHYLTDPDKDASFQRAVTPVEKVARNPARQGVDFGVIGGNQESDNTLETPEMLDFSGVSEEGECTRQESNLQPSDP